MGAAARRLTDLDQQGHVDIVDEGLVRRARAGDGQAMDQIISRYRGFVRLKASAYFLAGGDSEDLIQEGLIGLFKAVRDYRSEREGLAPMVIGLLEGMAKRFEVKLEIEQIDDVCVIGVRV